MLPRVRKAITQLFGLYYSVSAISHAYHFCLHIVAVRIGFENPSYVVSESAGSLMVCASLTGQLARDVVVTFFTEDGSATGQSILYVHRVLCSCYW